MNPVYFISSSFFKDYLAQNEKLEPFFAHKLYPNWQQVSKSVCASYPQHKVLQILEQQNRPYADSAMLKNMEALKSGNGVAIVTGQQLGLGISPLYIIYKTLTAIKCAKQYAKQDPHHKYIPIFWLEGEDHDFAEVNHFNIPAENGVLKRFALNEVEGQEQFSVNKRKLGAEIETVLSQLKDALPNTLFTESLFKKLEGLYQKDSNWLYTFKAHIQTLFKGSGLLFFNAGAKEVKQQSKPFFKGLIRKNSSVVQALSKQTLALQQAGYKPQVNIQQDRAYIFLNWQNRGRQALLRTAKGFMLKDDEEHFSENALLQLLEEKPEWFSSTVLTRPLWQSWLLPTVSYVGGAAEVSYWGQLNTAFNVLGLQMPHVQPRHSITLVEPKIKSLLKKYNINPATIEKNRATFIKNYFWQGPAGAVSAHFKTFIEQKEQHKKQSKQWVEQIDPTLSGPLDKTYNVVEKAFIEFEKRLLKQIKFREILITSHLEKIHSSLLPEGKLQERSISALYFENKYGPEWVLRLLDNLPDQFDQHHILEV